jgi:hypothetical protein
MTTIYLVTGYYEDQPNTEISVLMSDHDDVLPSLEDLKEGDPDLDYYDENIFFYGISEKELNGAINNKLEIGGLVPLFYEIDGQF